MNRDEIKADLKKYIADIRALNRQLDMLESQKQQLHTVGNRIEGIVAYLRKKMSDKEFEAMKVEIEQELDAEAAKPAVPQPAAAATAEKPQQPGKAKVKSPKVLATAEQKAAV